MLRNNKILELRPVWNILVRDDTTNFKTSKALTAKKKKTI